MTNRLAGLVAQIWRWSISDKANANVDCVNYELCDAGPTTKLVDADYGELRAIVNQEMPFGRFKGRKLIDIPEAYLVWFKNEGFPSGKLGERLAVMYEIKLNGLEAMLRPLVEKNNL